MKRTMKLLAGLLCLTLLIGAVPLVSVATEQASAATEESGVETIGPLAPIAPAEPAEPAYAEPAYAEPAYAGEYYDYPVKPTQEGMEAWHAAVGEAGGGHDGMIEVSQIPEDILEILTTEQLLKSCIRYPLARDLMFFDTPVAGLAFETLFFNGVQELLQRKDFAETLVNYYAALTSEDVAYDGNIYVGGSVDRMLYTEALIGYAAENGLLTAEDCAAIAAKREALMAYYPTEIFSCVAEAYAETSILLNRVCGKEVATADEALSVRVMQKRGEDVASAPGTAETQENN